MDLVTIVTLMDTQPLVPWGTLSQGSTGPRGKVPKSLSMGEPTDPSSRPDDDPSLCPEPRPKSSSNQTSGLAVGPGSDYITSARESRRQKAISSPEDTRSRDLPSEKSQVGPSPTPTVEYR